jgi:hypothetical protein
MWLLGTLLLVVIAILPFRPAHAQSPVQGDSDAYVEATVNNTNPFLGEEITYIFRYYEAVDSLRLPSILVGQPDYDAPEFANFWQEGDIKQINYQQQINSRLYNVSELHTTIFPTAAGDLEIPPAKLILDGGFSGRRIELNTLPVTVSVKPLPDANAALATDAVGDYTLTAKVDTQQTEVDQPISLQLELRGVGNIRLAPSIPAPVLDGWRVMEQSNSVSVQPMHTLATDSTDQRMGGTRTVNYLLIPSQAGEFTLPAIEYSFFDPLSGETKYALTNPITLTVTPGAGASTNQSIAQDSAFQSPLVAPGADPVDPAAVALNDESLAEQATADNAASGVFDPVTLMTPLMVSNLRQATAPLISTSWYWALWTLPVAAVGMAGWAAWRSQRVAQRQAKQQRTRAGSDALRQMHGQHTATPGEMIATAQRALLDFIGRKLNRPVSTMPRNLLAAELTGRGVQPTLVQQVVECMHMGDMARFSPAGVDTYSAMQMQATVEATIRDLDKVL